PGRPGPAAAGGSIGGAGALFQTFALSSPPGPRTYASQRLRSPQDRMDPAAVTPDTFNFIHLFLRADWVVKLVMLGLAGASLWSWTVIIDKTVRFTGLNRQADHFEDQVSSGRSLEEVATEAGERPRHALPRLLQTALKEWREAR